VGASGVRTVPTVEGGRGTPAGPMDEPPGVKGTKPGGSWLTGVGGGSSTGLVGGIGRLLASSALRRLVLTFTASGVYVVEVGREGGTNSKPYSSLDDEALLWRLGPETEAGGCNVSVERYFWRGLAVCSDCRL
jgi:hypothetical protein